MRAPERTVSQREMRGIGLDIGETNRRNLAERRMKRGECPTCGNKTHKVGIFGKRTALTVDGASLYGRCLLCNPVEGYTRRQPPPEQKLLPVPATIEAEDHDRDDGTMVSGITMDHRLIAGARNYPSSDDFIEVDTYADIDADPQDLIRPEPSVGPGDLDDDRPGRPSRLDDGRPMGGGGGGGRPMGPPRRYASQQEQQQHHHQQQQQQMNRAGMEISGDMDPQAGRVRFTHQHSAEWRREPFRATLDVHYERNPNGENANLGPRPVAVSPQPDGPANGDGPRRPQHSSLADTERREFQVHPSSTQATSYGRDVHNWDPSFNDGLSPDVDFRRNARENFNPQNPVNAHRTPYGMEANYDQRRGQAFPGANLQMQREEDVMFRAANFPHEAAGMGHPAPSGFNAVNPPVAQQEYQMHAQFETSDSRAQPTHTVRAPRSGESDWNLGEIPPLVDRNRRGMPDDDFADGPRPLTMNVRKVSVANIRTPPQVEPNSFDFRPSQDDPYARGGVRHSEPRSLNAQSVSDIPDLIGYFRSKSSSPSMIEQACTCLSRIVLMYGQEAKEVVRQYSGVEALVLVMWEKLGEPSLQAAASELLFTLAASLDGVGSSDILVGDNADKAVDALLVAMQTNITVEKMQQYGCGTFSCLASASGYNPAMNDGTLSGAVLSVVGAMEMHRTSLGVQEWGIRALYNQCLLSANAESNKMVLATSYQQGGGAGVGVIHTALESVKSDLTHVELACRLYWCLTASEEIAKILSATPDPILKIMNVVHNYRKRPEAAPMIEAAYGALVNLARVSERNHGTLLNSGAISAAIESIGDFHYDEELYVEACALLSNLAMNSACKREILKCDAINLISRLMQHYGHNETLQEEALGALLSLSCESVQAKIALKSNFIISSVTGRVRDPKSTSKMLELACCLLCSVSVERDGAQLIVESGSVNALLAMMEAKPHERKAQEAGFMTLRNVTCHGYAIDSLMRGKIILALTASMAAVPDSEAAQLNACCTLWNVVSKTRRDPSIAADAGAIEQVVKAMRSHMESGELLAVACGTLWCLIASSQDRKKMMVGSGAIDTVTSALVMHPREPRTLEKACGLLASICDQNLIAEAIAETQGIIFVVDAMRGNPTSLKLLEMGSLVLRNIVVTKPEHASAAADGIATIIKAMKENIGSASFQREACFALWALAVQSDDCKSKINALDGVSALADAYGYHVSSSDIQDAARAGIECLADGGMRM